MKSENAPYNGLRPAGSSEDPIVPMAERALETGNAEELTQLLVDSVNEDL